MLEPTAAGWETAIAPLGELTGEDCARMTGWRAALAARRQHFINHGPTAIDHAIECLETEWLDDKTAQTNGPNHI